MYLLRSSSPRPCVRSSDGRLRLWRTRTTGSSRLVGLGQAETMVFPLRCCFFSSFSCSSSCFMLHQHTHMLYFGSEMVGAKMGWRSSHHNGVRREDMQHTEAARGDVRVEVVVGCRRGWGG